MVRVPMHSPRNAFTMIELIFAIVVIAISVMSLPMMTRVTMQGMENNLVQEAIFASVAEINMATTFVWDDESLMDEADLNATLNNPTRVIFTGTANDCFDTGVLDATNNTNIFRRRGHINRRCLDSNGIGVSDVNTNGVALETSAHNYQLAFTGASSASAQKKPYYSRLVVNRPPTVTFGTLANNPNMKEILVEIQGDEDNNGVADGETVTLLRAYSTNIGEVAYAWEAL